MDTLVGLIVVILDIIAIIDVVKRAGSAGKKALWIALIVILPLIGPILYFFLGRKK